jgi:Fe-S-cluster containining protein
MTRYIEYDFPRNVATEYERYGACNGCGACCTGRLRYNFQRRSEAETFDMRQRGGGSAMNGKGIWQEVCDGDLHIFRQFVEHEPDGTQCTYLRGNLCAIHLADAPMICKLFPISPREIAPFPECSYVFFAVNAWPIVP